MKSIDKNKTNLIPVDMETHYKISQFLKFEYRLLDEEKFDTWLELMDEKIHYWMPGIENRRREDALQHGFYADEHMAYFDDGIRDLKRRVSRFQQPSAWAENPATRNIHSVSNIEAFIGDNAAEFIVYSVFQSVRSRGLDEQYVIYGRRKDIIIKKEEGFRIYKRLILIPNASLTCKSINTFL